MKIIILSLRYALCIALFSALSSQLYSQGNLQFNQVIIGSTSDLTVPVGKVWKIESYQQQQVGVSQSGVISGCSDLSRPRPFFIDGISYHNIKFAGYGGSNVPVSAANEFPIWLKTGQVVKTSCSGDFLSIIEFNIIP
jgi:hypothetical protein